MAIAGKSVIDSDHFLVKRMSSTWKNFKSGPKAETLRWNPDRWERIRGFGQSHASNT